MSLDPKEVAERLGAEHIAQLPNTGGGAFGMARLAEIIKIKDRFGNMHGSSVRWIPGSKVPVSPQTEKMLIALAEKLSTPERRIEPLQLAAHLLEESVRKLANEVGP
jgi:hypothetical protein